MTAFLLLVGLVAMVAMVVVVFLTPPRARPWVASVLVLAACLGVLALVVQDLRASVRELHRLVLQEQTHRARLERMAEQPVPTVTASPPPAPPAPAVAPRDDEAIKSWIVRRDLDLQLALIEAEAVRKGGQP